MDDAALNEAWENCKKASESRKFDPNDPTIPIRLKLVPVDEHHRHVVIRDAAFAVLKHIYDPRFADFEGFSSENEEDMYPVFVELRKAFGVTVKELRGSDASR